MKNLKSKDITCAVLIKQNKKIFMCHSTGNNFWDLPKGIKEEKESHKEAAIRELKEETGFEVTEDEIELINIFPYTQRKNIAVFKYVGNKIFDEKKAICSSLFINKYNGLKTPEVNGFRFLSKKERFEECSKRLLPILEKVL